ncbi:MAG: DNA gyrase inhibitor YacG [Burkholderiales bacterium]|nr:DNA gyrase inhibitor YacG [Burkholderiales bacterium]
MTSKIVRCPQCSKSMEYRIDNLSRPFCSARCKMIDLGAWAEERYAIAGPTSSSGEPGVKTDSESGLRAAAKNML